VVGSSGTSDFLGCISYLIERKGMRRLGYEQPLLGGPASGGGHGTRKILFQGCYTHDEFCTISVRQLMGAIHYTGCMQHHRRINCRSKIRLHLVVRVVLLILFYAISALNKRSLFMMRVARILSPQQLSANKCNLMLRSLGTNNGWL
jgi:hypothetical protein